MIKEGDRVEVVSKCLTQGCYGTVMAVYNGSRIATVQLDKNTLPNFYTGNGTHDYSVKSLAAISKKEMKQMSDLSGRIGIFFDSYSDYHEYKRSGTMATDCVFVVTAHTKEHCLRILNKKIEEMDFDDDAFDFLLFDNQMYRIKPVCGVTFDYEHDEDE
jgi:hypothetical protein